MDVEGEDPRSQPNMELSAANSKIDDVNSAESSASNSNAISMNKETTKSTDSNIPSNSTDPVEAIMPNASSEPLKTDEVKDTNASSVLDVSGKGDKIHVHVATSNKSIEDQNSDEKKEICPSTDEEHNAKINPANLSDEQKKDSEQTSASQTEPNTSHQSKINSNIEQFLTSDITEICYKDKNEPDLLETILNNATDKRLIDQLLGCAYGQALGDAYGLSTEFEDREDVARKYPNCLMIPFPNYVLTGHNMRWARGDWTDDTDQWILILLTLVFHNANENVFAQKLRNWIRFGYRELGDHGGMGLGANVSQVVCSSDFISNPLEASQRVWENSNRQAAPNGAVMRCSASAFVHFKDPKKVIKTTELMCKTTHFDPRCIASCLAVCLAATYLLQGSVNDNDQLEKLIQHIQEETIDIIGDRFTPNDIELFRWYTDKRTPEELILDEPGKIGYTYKCLASGFYGLRSTDSFEQTLHNIIRFGGDADTNGAVCGTLYGARHGYKNLPYEWLRSMPNKKWLDQIIIKCLDKMNLIENTSMETNE